MMLGKTGQQIYNQLQIITLRKLGYTGSNIKIGHLDTGIDTHHPAIQHQPFAFQYFDRYGFAIDNITPFDSAQHGSSIASIICGRLENGHPVGIAPDSKLYSGVVLEHGNIISRILFGMAWMLEQKVQILCLPLGIPGYTSVFTTLIHLLRQQGVLVVASIGNLGAGRSLSPGNYQNVLSVGAANTEGTVAKFSGSYHPHGQQTCTKPDILAPGTDIWAAKPGGGYQTVKGTSTACALVAGVAALLLQAAPSASPSLIEAALVNTSTPLPQDKGHRCRGGIINPEAALCYLLNHQAQLQDLQISAQDTNRRKLLPDHLFPSDQYIDPRLQAHFRYTSENYILEVIVVVSQNTEELDNEDLRGAAGNIIDRVASIQREEPKRVRYIPAANIAVVLAKIIFIKMLIADPLVRIVSATDIDRVKL